MPPYPTTTMRTGDHGDHVRRLQALLNRDYPAYSKLDEDGAFGPKTEAVIREFQRRAGLPVNGIACPETLTKLDELTTQGGAGDQNDCGGGVFAGPSTSCEFAQNVRDKYFSVPGDSCRSTFSARLRKRPTPWPASGTVTGSRAGGNNAVVTFSLT